MKKLKNAIITLLLLGMALIFLFPLILTISNSFMSKQEISESYSMINNKAFTNETQNNNVFAETKLIPREVTIDQYYTALIEKTQFLFMFWNSIKIVIPIVLGQILAASMAAYAFAKFKFKWRQQLFFVYIIVMLMPFQVTLVPNYIIADKLGLINSYLSIIFPGIFSTFGVFLLKQYMEYVPDAYIEAAKVDGASHFHIFIKLIMPMSRGGIAAMAILVFIDNWGMVEQPLIFLNDTLKQPLSIYLSSINSGEVGIAFAASTIFMFLMIITFLYGENHLVEGIQNSGIKG
jgi:multiple sugar transport system permease protein